MTLHEQLAGIAGVDEIRINAERRPILVGVRRGTVWSWWGGATEDAALHRALSAVRKRNGGKS